MNNHQLEVQIDTNGEAVLVLPDEIVSKLGWKEDDTLKFKAEKGRLTFELETTE